MESTLSLNLLIWHGLVWSSLGVWIALIFLHGGITSPYWVRRHRLEAKSTNKSEEKAPLLKKKQKPGVVIIIPARNEADILGQSLPSLLSQQYEGRLDIILIDDCSDDDTAKTALAVAREQGRSNRLTVMKGRPTPPGWTGKLWAMNAGLEKIKQERKNKNPAYILFTDADIHHQPGLLSALVTKAEQDKLDSVSLMVVLHRQGFWEQFLIPAFVYFFRLLYPFSAVNNPDNSIAAAAGGCLLVRARALKRIGGLEPIKSSIIDDCALARALKKQGEIWLGLTGSAVSLRSYGNLEGVWQMVTRSAYAQLRYSPWLLMLSLAGLCLMFLLPPLALGEGLWQNRPTIALPAALAWGLMSLTYIPMLREYKSPLSQAISLPVATCVYMLMTLDSARRHWQGQGVAWKHRLYASPGDALCVKPASATGSQAPAGKITSGKGSGDENFPVGSRLLPRHLRPHIASFYAFARASDDIADTPHLKPQEKIHRLDAFEAALRARTKGDTLPEEALRLRNSLGQTGVTPRHACDLLVAFRKDARKNRYANWQELLEYCQFSAAPVGRYLLDLHGEDPSLYPHTDALCNALQILNHLQDCGQDYQNLDRVYLPQDWLEAETISVNALDNQTTSPPLRAVLNRLLQGVETLLTQAEEAPSMMKSPRLAAETAIILNLAHRLQHRLSRQDPLAGPVKLQKIDFMAATLSGLWRILWRKSPAPLPKSV